MKTAKEISEMLAAQAEAVAVMLFPAGKRVGSEWAVSDPSSLKIHLHGARAGLWARFAGDEKGDLLDLWKFSRGCDFVTALKQAKDFLGVKDDRSEGHAFKSPAPAKKYVRPLLDQHEPLTSGGPVYDYLTKIRRLDPSILRAYRIEQVNNSKFGPSMVFPIFDERGLAVDMVKYLAVKRADDGKKMIWATADSRPHLFGWQAVSKDARDIVICEGEIDALTVAGWGHAAMSIPSGVKNLDWIEHDFDALARFDRVLLLTDADAPGHACAEAIAARLGRDRCFRVLIPGFKDANEAEMSGKFVGPDFDECLARAKTLDPASLRNASEYADVLWAELNPSADTLGSETPWGIDWRIRPGEVTIWTGWSGHGKSLILNQLVLHDFATTASRVLIASFEMKASKTIAQLSKMAVAKQMFDRSTADSVCAWLGQGFWFYDVFGYQNWREFLPIFAYAVKRYGIRRIVIDSLLRCGIAEDDYEGQKTFVSELVAFAEKHSVHIHLVAHSRKKDDETKPPGKLDIRGTAAITDLVHNGWSLFRNKDKENQVKHALAKSVNGTIPQELKAMSCAQIACWKNRETGDEPFQYLWLNHASKQFCANPSARATVYAKF